MGRRLQLLVRDGDYVVEKLLLIGLQSVVLEAAEDGVGVWVQVEPSDLGEEPEDLWFELSWHADKLGVINGRYVGTDGT